MKASIKNIALRNTLKFSLGFFVLHTLADYIFTDTSIVHAFIFSGVLSAILGVIWYYSHPNQNT